MAQTPINTDPVVGDELIDISWGNAVRGDLIRLADRKVELDGSLAMTGRLTLASTDPTSANHAVRLAYANATYLRVSGNTVDVDMNGHTLIDLNPVPPGPNAAVPRDWALAQFVNVAGDTMTGSLIVNNPPGQSIGVSLSQAGQIAAAINTSGTASLNLRRGAAADAVGQVFINFEHGDPPGVQIGHIDIGPDATHVRYNTSSDYRQKHYVGPITDAAERVLALARQAYRGTWVSGTTERDFLNAHDIAEVAPYAASGAKDAVDDTGKPVLQGVDFGQLVPLLVAALGSALDRIAMLEASR